MNAQFWRVVRSLLVHRQAALAYLVAAAVAGVAIDLAVSESGDRFTSFSRFSRHEFDGDVVWQGFSELDHASALAWIVVLLAIPVSALLAGWLGTCYLIALGDGRSSLRAAPRTVVQLALFSLVLGLFDLLEAGLYDHGHLAISSLLALASTPPTLFAAYAIVFDDVHALEGARRSLRMFRKRPRPAIVSMVVFLVIVQLFIAAFDRGFHDSTHVEPTYLAAWLLAGVLLTFATDAVLLTLYRATRVSAGGSGGSSAAGGRPGASD